MLSVATSVDSLYYLSSSEMALFTALEYTLHNFSSGQQRPEGVLTGVYTDTQQAHERVCVCISVSFSVSQ